MIVGTKFNQRTSAAANRRLTMLLFCRHRTLSRRQLVEMTGLRGSTLTYIIREMMDKNLVRTAGRRESALVGKKQILLEINPELGYVIGVELRQSGVYVVLQDAAGTFLDDLSLTGRPTFQDLPEYLFTQIALWLDRRGTPQGQLLGLGVGVPGVVDVQAGVVLRSTGYAATNVPLAQPLAGYFKTPIVIDHNVNLAAFAEAQRGAGLGLTDFIVFTMNHGSRNGIVDFKSYGTALYLKGELYRGVHFASGELDIGMAPPDLQGTEDDLIRLAQPDAPLSAFLAQLADAVGVSIAHTANLLDPQAIILGGDQPIANAAFLGEVQAALDRRLIHIANRAIPVILSPLGDRSVAQGGALAAAENARIERATN